MFHNENADININDCRQLHHFSSITFSNFKKTDVKKELLKNLINSKIEQSCYWCAELICAGHYIEIWEILLGFYSKYIHLGNVKISVYLEMRINNFKDIITNNIDNELQLRNIFSIRKIFCEIICILCISKRKHSFNNIKIGEEDFVLLHLNEKYKAPDISFANNIILEDDPPEVFAVTNEFSYSISNKCKNSITACYWFEWLVEYEHKCKLNHNKLKCEKRIKIPVDNKYQSDIIWIIWDAILYESSLTNNILIQKVINALLTIFTLKYSSSCSKKRKYVIYFAISVLCENISNDDIINNSEKEFIQNIIDKINLIYLQIKENEQNDQFNELEYSNNSNANNLDKTIEKLDKINNFDELFLPRIE
jgi:hypothetical protein